MNNDGFGGKINGGKLINICHQEIRDICFPNWN